MNRAKLAQMQFKRVRVRPIARRVDRFGRELEPIDDSWPIMASSRDSLTLQNPRSGQNVDLGADHVREYMTDPGRSDGFWSLVKRGIGGLYHNVSAKYLQTYLDEYCFRFNRRDQGNLLFKRILEQVSLKAS